jgi:Alanine racemase, N-terminal domain
MPLVLHVDTTRWRAHQHAVVARAGGPQAVVPVVKGNGYGPGRTVVAAETARLGTPYVAVGTYDELPDAAERTPADLLVLTPWRPGTPADDDRVLHTVSRLDDLARLATAATRPRVVVEVLTSMRRHGVPLDSLGRVAALLPGVRFEGWALHLPLSRVDAVAEARWLGLAARASAPGPLWVSHVPAERLAEVGDDVRLRTGTRLWLGDRGALRWSATVLDVHELAKGETYGYRQRAARRASTLLVMAGGTSHGIGLEGPNAAVTSRQRATALARGALGAAGHVRSPYRLEGRTLVFAEPPHMQCSLVWAPAAATIAIGDELDLAVRYTTTLPDEVRLA